MDKIEIKYLTYYYMSVLLDKSTKKFNRIKVLTAKNKSYGITT